MHIYGKYPSMSGMSVTVDSTANNKRSTDIHFGLDNNKQVINTQLYWRPNLYEQTKVQYISFKCFYEQKCFCNAYNPCIVDVQDNFNTGRERFMRKAAKHFADLRVEVKQEVNARRDQMAASDLHALYSQINEEWQSVTQDFGQLHQEWKQMVDENEFYIADVISLTSDITDIIR